MSVAFSSNDILLASGSNGKNIRIWNTHTWETIRTLQGQSSWVYSAAMGAT